MLKKSIVLFLFFLGVLMSSSLPKHYHKTLDNGLQIVVIPMKNNSNVITTDIFYKVGSRNEIMGKSGIAHMLEHLNFKSTKNLKSGEFDEIVKRYGGVNNASTGFDFTHYYIKSSSGNLGKSLELFAELMQNLSLKDKEFQPERDVVMEERRWRTDNNPLGWLYFNLFNAAYLYHPYHWTPIGFIDDIANWTINDIRSFHKTFYSPNNAIVVVAGDVDEKKVFEEGKKYFGSIKSSGKIPVVYQKEPEQKGERRVVLNKDSEVEMVAVAYHIPSFNDEDQIALSAIAEILGNGKSSRFYKKIVTEKKLANQIWAYGMDSIDPGLFLMYGMCNEGVSAEDLEREIIEIVEDLKNGKIDDDELEKIKTNARADFIFGMEDSSSLANLFGSYYARGDIEPLLTYEDKISKLKIDKIKEVANKYFKKEKSTTVILRKEAK